MFLCLVTSCFIMTVTRLWYHVLDALSPLCLSQSSVYIQFMSPCVLCYIICAPSGLLNKSYLKSAEQPEHRTDPVVLHTCSGLVCTGLCGFLFWFVQTGLHVPGCLTDGTRTDSYMLPEHWKPFIQHDLFTHSYEHFFLSLSAFTHIHMDASDCGDNIVPAGDQTTDLLISRWAARPPVLQPPQQMCNGQKASNRYAEYRRRRLQTTIQYQLVTITIQIKWLSHQKSEQP